MKKILQEFPDIFTALPRKTDLVECDLKLTFTDPVKVKQYPMPYSMAEEVKKEVQQMQKMGVIERSDSQYSVSIVMVKKTRWNEQMLHQLQTTQLDYVI